MCLCVCVANMKNKDANLDAHMISDNGIKSIVWRKTRFSKTDGIHDAKRRCTNYQMLSPTFQHFSKWDKSKCMGGICEQIHFHRMTWLNIIAMAEILPNGDEFEEKNRITGIRFMTYEDVMFMFGICCQLLSQQPWAFSTFLELIFLAILRLFDNNMFQATFVAEVI